jgi:hypothetical protein
LIEIHRDSALRAHEDVPGIKLSDSHANIGITYSQSIDPLACDVRSQDEYRLATNVPVSLLFDARLP